MYKQTKFFRRAFWILTLVLMLAGCGGGGGSGGAGGGGGGTIGSGPPLSQKALYDSASDVASKLSTLMTTGSGAGDAQAIAAYLQTKTEFTAVGVNADNSVWARYTDGTSLIVFSNRSADGSVAMDSTGTKLRFAQARELARAYWDAATRRVSAALVAPAAAASGAAPGSTVLPKGKVAVTLNVLGYGGSASSLFVSALNSSGYIASDEPGSVADFRAINNVAVLHVSSHGALLQTADGSLGYTLGTSELFPEACFDPGCDANVVDRQAHVLDIGIFPDKAKPYYVIRPEFVKKYWHLAPNAVVFLDACGSMSGGPTEDAMRQAIKGAGAISIVGWTSPVSISGSAIVFSYLFDRILGANSYQPESPPQRPFSVSEVIDYMASKGLDKDPSQKDPNAAARIQLVGYGPDASILVPSIKYIEVQEDEARLIVHGQFGAVPGSAKIDTLDRTPAPWTNDAMLIDLPINASGSSGAVVVYGPDGQMSNAVPLTEFNGTMTLTRTLGTTMAGPGFTDVADCTLLHFRADVHAYRDAPGATPSDGGSMIENFAKNIKCTWKMTGSDAFRSVNDSGTLPWADNTVNSPPPFIGTTGSVIGGAAHALILNLNCRANADLKVTDPLTGNVTHTNGPMICLYGTETSGLMPLQSDYSLPDKTFSITPMPPGSTDTINLRLHFTTVSPPDDKTEQ